MPEQKILITIDEDGGIQAKSSGFQGESCLDALEQLLEPETVLQSLKKTDEFHQQQKVRQSRHQTLKRSW